MEKEVRLSSQGDCITLVVMKDGDLTMYDNYGNLIMTLDYDGVGVLIRTLEGLRKDMARGRELQSIMNSVGKKSDPSGSLEWTGFAGEMTKDDIAFEFDAAKRGAKQDDDFSTFEQKAKDWQELNKPSDKLK